MRALIKPLIFCLIAFWQWGLWDPFRFARPGFIAQDPVVTASNAPSFPFTSFGLWPRHFLIEPRATYDITGRVLHKRQYVTYGFFGDVIPYDFALGWKGMSDLKIIRPYMTFDHHGAHSMGRYYTYQYHWDAQTPSDYAAAMADTSNKSNNHLIPADAETFAKLWWVNTGDIIHLKGYLVDIEWPAHPGWIWKTALTPAENHFAKWGDDNPDCQTIFVTDVTVN